MRTASGAAAEPPHGRRVSFAELQNRAKTGCLQIRPAATPEDNAPTGSILRRLGGRLRQRSAGGRAIPHSCSAAPVQSILVPTVEIASPIQPSTTRFARSSSERSRCQSPGRSNWERNSAASPRHETTRLPRSHRFRRHSGVWGPMTHSDRRLPQPRPQRSGGPARTEMRSRQRVTARGTWEPVWPMPGPSCLSRARVEIQTKTGRDTSANTTSVRKNLHNRNRNKSR